MKYKNKIFIIIILVIVCIVLGVIVYLKNDKKQNNNEINVVENKEPTKNNDIENKEPIKNNDIENKESTSIDNNLKNEIEKDNKWITYDNNNYNPVNYDAVYKFEGIVGINKKLNIKLKPNFEKRLEYYDGFATKIKVNNNILDIICNGEDCNSENKTYTFDSKIVNILPVDSSGGLSYVYVLTDNKEVWIANWYFDEDNSTKKEKKYTNVVEIGEFVANDWYFNSDIVIKKDNNLVLFKNKNLDEFKYYRLPYQGEFNSTILVYEKDDKFLKNNKMLKDKDGNNLYVDEIFSLTEEDEEGFEVFYTYAISNNILYRFYDDNSSNKVISEYYYLPVSKYNISKKGDNYVAKIKFDNNEIELKFTSDNYIQ